MFAVSSSSAAIRFPLISALIFARVAQGELSGDSNLLERDFQVYPFKPLCCVLAPVTGRAGITTMD